MFRAPISKFNKLTVFWKLSLLIIALLISYYVYSHWFATASSVTTYNLATVSRGDIITSVAGTGQVIADSQVDVKAQGSGQVTAIYIAQGDTVKSGQIIARLDARSAATSLAQAQNNYRSAQANYNKAVAGLTTTENALAQTPIDTAKTSLLNTQQSAVDKLQSTYVQTLDLVNATNKLFVVPTDAYPTFSGDSILFNNEALMAQVVRMRIELNQELPTLKQTLDQSQTSTALTDIDSTASTLEKAYTYFDTLNRLFVNYSIQDNNSSSIEAYKNSTASARSSVRSSISTLNTLKQNITSAEDNIAQSQLTYQSKVEPLTSDDLTIQKSSLENARLSVVSASNNYENTVVRAPFNGVVASVNAKVGETSASSIATIITSKKIAQISVGESDVIKLKIGQKATLVLDALGETTYTGKVVGIDAVGTVTQGVVTYNVKIAFDIADDLIKPNMSVSATVITSVTTGVLTLNTSAVKTRNNSSSVQKVDEKLATTSLESVILAQTPVTQTVEVGVENGELVEIKSGLVEGDVVVLKTNKATTQTTSSSNSVLSMFGSSRTGATGNRSGAVAGGGIMIPR